MKTDQAERDLDTDYGVDIKPRAVPPLETPPQPSPPRRRLGLVTAAVGALLVMIAAILIAAVVAMPDGTDQVEITDSPLYDQSITAREQAPGAPAPQGSLFDQSVRAREGAATVPQQDSLLDQSVRARESRSQPQASVADQRFASRYSASQEADSVLHQSITARDR